jgi:hypothetical protein
MAIGARSQSARTYLEKHLNEFATSSLDDLIKHALRALRDTLPNEIELTTKVNSTLRIKFRILFDFFLIHVFLELLVEYCGQRHGIYDLRRREGEAVLGRH